jgi:hypothetical protein
MYCTVCVKICKILERNKCRFQPEKDDSYMVPEDEDSCKVPMCQLEKDDSMLGPSMSARVG